MDIRVGTKVRFLNATGGGVVKEFTDDKIALVETTDGFDMPVLVTDLIIDKSASYNLDDKEPEGSETVFASESPEINTPQVTFEEKKYADFKGEILLALVPENDQILHVSNFELHVINDSNYYFHYAASLKDSGVSSFIVSGDVDPDTKLEIAKYNQTDLSKIKEFRLQGIFYKQGLFQPVEPVDLVFNTENINFYKIQFFKENDYFHQKALILRKEKEDQMQEAINKLKDKNWSEIIKDKEQPEKKERKRSPRNINPEEVDLHIEELVDNHAELSNGEIMNIQLSRFELALETAIRSKTQKIVFIHGVGNGVLKHELSKKLDKKYPDLRYQDASFKEYGYGATMVYLK